ncbi:MAG: glycosyl transferase family 1, partial [Candidatus Neomarinimicrobiota bacterium]
MRISIIGPAYPYRGGIALHNNLLYKEFSNKHTTEIINFKRQYPGILFPGKTQYEESKTFAHIPSFRILDSINPISWHKAANHIKLFSPDLIIIQFWMPFFSPCYGRIVRLLKKNSCSKTIIICHNIVPHEGSPIDKLLTKYLFSKADGFIIQAHSVEKDLLELRPDAKYRYNPHPIYNIFGNPLDKTEARKQLGIKEKNVILYFGYIRKYKGVKYLIRAVPEILKKLDLKVIIAGEFYEDKKQYLQEIRNIDREGKIALIDRYIPDEDVNTYFSAADLVVLPYINATQSGIVQIALSYNLPCVV